MFEAVVTEHSPLSPSVRLITFARINGELVNFIPGQYVVIRSAKAECPYSLAEPPNSRGTLTICAKITPPTNALECARLMSTLDVGSKVCIDFPTGTLRFQPELAPIHLFVATGTGIAPFHAMLHQLHGTSTIERAYLVQGAQQESELLFREDWKALAQTNSRFVYRPTVTQQHGGSHLSVGRVETIVEDLFNQLPTDRLCVYLCGHSTMVEHLRNWFVSRAVAPNRIFYDA